jgi:putative membrane protein
MGYGYGHSGGMMMAQGGAGVFAFIFGLLFFIILVALAVILVRFAIRGGRRGMWRHHMMQHGSSMETLKERYAKGEIEKPEFEQKKKDLMA